MASSNEINPYAAPQTPLVAQAVADGEAWRDGAWLVCRKESHLPGRCVKCNEPVTSQPLKKKFYWHPPVFYVLIVISLIIYVIVALIVRKTATVHIGLCDRHVAKRRTGVIVGWLLFFVGLGTMFAAGSAKGDAVAFFVLGGIGLMLAGAIFGIVMAQTLRPKKIDNYFAWYTGACPEFLAELPDSPIQR
jgi:hypothetical protein